MTREQLRDLFFQTGLPEVYVLAGRTEREEDVPPALKPCARKKVESPLLSRLHFNK